MSERRKFYVALIFSLGLHAIGLYLFARTNEVRPLKPMKSIEVVYQKIPSPKIPKTNPTPEALKIERKSLPIKDVELLQKDYMASTKHVRQIQDITKIRREVELGRKDYPQLKTPDLNRRFFMPSVKLEKMSNPRYLNFHEEMTSKIKRVAYAYAEHPDISNGEVYVTYILGKGGKLKAIKIVESKTKANEFLKSLVKRIIEESQPFPSFPKGLDYPELTFNIVISFQVEQ